MNGDFVMEEERKLGSDDFEDMLKSSNSAMSDYNFLFDQIDQ